MASSVSTAESGRRGIETNGVDVITEAEHELQRLTPERRARDAEGVADLLRLLGPLTDTELRERTTDDPSAWIDDLVAQRRALRVSDLCRDDR